jgi:hypothetical protein
MLTDLTNFSDYDFCFGLLGVFVFFAFFGMGMDGWKCFALLFFVVRGILSLDCKQTRHPHHLVHDPPITSPFRWDAWSAIVKLPFSSPVDLEDLA